FDAEGPVATLDKVRSAQFTPLGSEVDPLIARALQRDPSQRFESAAQMQAALEAFVHERRLKLDPAPLAELVAQRTGRRSELANAFSGTRARRRPAVEVPTPVPHKTKVLAGRSARPRPVLPFLLGAAALVAGGFVFWPRPQEARQIAAPPPLPVVAP